jgi:hypothetical protein
MIRKQLYISEAQNEALKRRARALGVSEAELARRALDDLLDETSPSGTPRRHEALDRLMKTTRRLSDDHRLPSDYRFSRDELYADRASRWTRSNDNSSS